MSGTPRLSTRNGERESPRSKVEGQFQGGRSSRRDRSRSSRPVRARRMSERWANCVRTHALTARPSGAPRRTVGPARDERCDRGRDRVKHGEQGVGCRDHQRPVQQSSGKATRRAGAALVLLCVRDFRQRLDPRRRWRLRFLYGSGSVALDAFDVGPAGAVRVVVYGSGRRRPRVPWVMRDAIRHRCGRNALDGKGEGHHPQHELAHDRTHGVTLPQRARRRTGNIHDGRRALLEQGRARCRESDTPREPHASAVSTW
jgi:hypothetical protein